MINEIIQFLVGLGEQICDRTHDLLNREDNADLTKVSHRSQSDVIYQLDAYAEQLIVVAFAERAKSFGGIVLIAEGIGEEDKSIYPQGMSEEEAAWRILMDPIDGTRGLMYDKRSAFFLAGIAKNLGAETSLQDLEASVMVELSTSKMLYADSLSARRGEGLCAYRRNLINGDVKDLSIVQNPVKSLRGGFGQVARFFAPGRDLLAKLEEDLFDELYPDAQEGEILSFEDQYISTGGQLYEMIMGKDRFIADVRHRLFSTGLTKRKGHVCHPYDMAALVVAEEAGVILTDAYGQQIQSLFDTNLPLDWIAYANGALQKEIEASFLRIAQRLFA